MRTSEWQRRFVIGVSIPLVLMISFVSLTGIYTDNFYLNESSNWQIQCVGQDIFNLVLVVPFLIISALLTFFNRRAGLALWCGTILYLIYTFVIYSFSVHYNELFVLYTSILGISFYSFLYILYKQAKERIPWRVNSRYLSIMLSGYFVLIALVFYGLWLKEIIGALASHRVPTSLSEANLFTNPVHALDLSVMLPFMVLVGYLLFKGNHLGVLLAPVLLTFMILMDISIAVLAAMLSSDQNVPNSISIVLFLLAVPSLFMLVAYFRKLTVGT